RKIACVSVLIRQGPIRSLHQRSTLPMSPAGVQRMVQSHWEKDMAYFDLGPYSRQVTTSSPDAQLWFDRGLNWLFGFNHGEAIKCFHEALKHDPECAMAHWGASYASGPN